jgi:hypothetical protein
MHISTDEQKKAIRAVLECRETYESQEDALQAAESALEAAPGNYTIESLQITELQDMDFVEMHIGTLGDKQRVRWKLTGAARAQLESEQRAWFESQVQVLGGISQDSMSPIEPSRLSNLELARFAAGDTAIREQMLAYVRQKMMHKTKARGQSG